MASVFGARCLLKIALAQSEAASRCGSSPGRAARAFGQCQLNSREMRPNRSLEALSARKSGLAAVSANVTYTVPRLRGGPEQYLISQFMSQHRSLRATATLGGKRNVLKRFERLEILKKRGDWKEGDRITGLRKTKAQA